MNHDAKVEARNSVIRAAAKAYRFQAGDKVTVTVNNQSVKATVIFASTSIVTAVTDCGMHVRREREQVQKGQRRAVGEVSR